MRVRNIFFLYVGATVVIFLIALPSMNQDVQNEHRVSIQVKKDIPKVEETSELTATLMSSAMASYNFEQWVSVEEANKQAELQRQAEEARQAQLIEDARLAAARAEASRPAPVMTSQGCCGPHSDAWWQGVAICEQGGRNDPYFGYFSFMDGSQGGKSWSEQVAAGNALLARAGREIGPWAASCVAAGYRSSPGG